MNDKKRFDELSAREVAELTASLEDVLTGFDIPTKLTIVMGLVKKYTEPLNEEGKIGVINGMGFLLLNRTDYEMQKR